MYYWKTYKMKRTLLLIALFISSTMFKVADAQVNVQVNIGRQPVWGPAGYDFVEYYYFPDIDVYYSVPQQQFIFFDGRQWVYAYSLPGMYSNFDLYRSYKVVINEPNPFLRNDYYRSRYVSYRGMYGRQPIIYNSPDPRYYVIENHPQHERWLESNRRNNGGYRPDNRVDYRRANDDRRYDNNNYNNRGTYGRTYDNRTLNDRRTDNNRGDYNGRRGR
jgi:hypothetical protein